MLDTIKILLGLEGDELDYQLETIIELTQRRLMVLLGGVEEIPESLEYIVSEVSVIRFNRIGSEGVSSHTVEGESMTFADDDFGQYMDDIETYLEEQADSKRGRVRFL